jgi:hypothetical protein
LQGEPGAVNTLVKAALAGVLGGRGTALRVGAISLLDVFCGALAL